jgi:CBS domain-containing protein
MNTVKKLLKEKGYDIWSISPDAKVFEALQLMARKDVGALLVIEKGDLVGILSERDYARKVALEGKSSKETTVRETMTSKVIGVHPDNTVEDCMALMTEKHVRHLPVIDQDKLIGVISIGDVVKSIITDQGIIIEQLVNCITGR